MESLSVDEIKRLFEENKRLRRENARLRTVSDSSMDTVTAN